MEAALTPPLSVQHSIQSTVQALWQQLVAQRRQELEDTFKIDLSVSPGGREVKMEEVTPLWEETMLKAWQNYLGSSRARAPPVPRAFLPRSFGWGLHHGHLVNLGSQGINAALPRGKGKTRGANRVRGSRNLSDGRAAMSTLTWACSLGV